MVTPTHSGRNFFDTGIVSPGLPRIRFWANYKRTFIQQRFAIDIESGVPDEAVEMNGYAYGTAHPRVITKSNVHRT